MAPELRFTPFSADRVDTVLAIDGECYPDPWTRGMFEQELRNETSCFVVGERDGQVAAYGGFWLLLDEAHITKVTVAPAFRGCGFGRALMLYLLSEAEQRGAESMRLEVRESNAVARALYETLGFRQEFLRKGYYAGTNEAAVVMVKSLTG
jgi:ribosomal-protein-alanine N-acetyltransferase